MMSGGRTQGGHREKRRGGEWTRLSIQALHHWSGLQAFALLETTYLGRQETRLVCAILICAPSLRPMTTSHLNKVGK